MSVSKEDALKVTAALMENLGVNETDAAAILAQVDSLDLKKVKNLASGNLAVAVKLASDTLVRGGDKIIVPEQFHLRQVVTLLEDQIEYESTSVEIIETIDGSFWDGIYAFGLAMHDVFGWVQAKPQATFFGEIKPTMHSLPSGVNTSVLVAWGKFDVPGIDGHIFTDAAMKDGRVVFVIKAEVKRRNEKQIRALAELTRLYAKTKSLYRGKAVRIKFVDDKGQMIKFPEPKFMDVEHLNVDSLILPKSVGDAVATSIFTPIQKSEICRTAGIPLKRGILLSGPYGTGKTLTASVTAKLAQQNGWTYIYVPTVAELESAIRFAHAYQPAVVFCEDIDRGMNGERSVSMDNILNIIDGIESKGVELMIILTTNHAENLNQALVRPGRLDDVIDFLAPDGPTVERLIRHYGGDLITADTDLTAAGLALAGRIPAVIREAVERAKLSEIRVSGTTNRLSGEALTEAAVSMNAQLVLLDAEVTNVSPATQLATSLGTVLKPMVKQAIVDANNE